MLHKAARFFFFSFLRIFFLGERTHSHNLSDHVCQKDLQVFVLVLKEPLCHFLFLSAQGTSALVCPPITPIHSKADSGFLLGSCALSSVPQVLYQPVRNLCTSFPTSCSIPTELMGISTCTVPGTVLGLET